MGSSKKKGQQRKAAAKRAQSAETMASSINNSVSEDAISGNSSHSKIVAKVRRGNNYATKRLTSTSGMSIEEGFSYEQSGVLSIVLEFLKRCEHETFDQVLSSVGGDLKSPSLWINIVRVATFEDQSCKLHIVQNIGPLVRCMVKDTDRLFFKGNKHWVESVKQFVFLVKNVMGSKANTTLESEQIVSTMLQYEGLLSSIVQWSFWRDEYRPDIIKELKYEGLADDCSIIIAVSRRILDQLVSDETGFQAEGRIWLLNTLGTTPIINKSYDPSCMVSYTAGIVSRLKKGLAKDVFDTVQRLIRDADCVDKGVITEIIDLGTNYSSHHETAVNVALLSLEMIHQGAPGKSQVRGDIISDTRAAFAIREGLVEMCLGFIERFGEYKSFGEKDGLHDHIKQVFRSIHLILLHKKTAKAITNKRHIIEGRLVCLEQNTLLTNKPESKKLLDMVRSILSLNGAYCCRCNKSMSKTEVKQCNGCHSMSYCSRTCQRKDWLNGHSVTCCRIPAMEDFGQFQGRYEPEEVPANERAATKMKELEINMTMIQLKLFLDHSETILSQASSLNLPLHDCVAIFDLLKCPPRAMVVNYTELYERPDQRKMFEERRSKENITCIYFSYILNGELNGDGDEIPVIQMQRLFPRKWLMKQGK